MVSQASLQRLLYGLGWALTFIGIIATIYPYLTIKHGTANCQENTTGNYNRNDCGNSTNEGVKYSGSNTLRIIGPVFIVCGLVTLPLVKRWKLNSRNQPASDAISSDDDADGETNECYEGSGFDFGCPPSYSEAIQMRVVIERDVTVPMEAPPKYDDAISVIEESQEVPVSTASVASSSTADHQASSDIEVEHEYETVPEGGFSRNNRGTASENHGFHDDDNAISRSESEVGQNADDMRESQPEESPERGSSQIHIETESGIQGHNTNHEARTDSLSSIPQRTTSDDVYEHEYESAPERGSDNSHGNNSIDCQGNDNHHASISNVSTDSNNENLDSEIATPQQTDEEEVSFSTDVFNSCNIQSIHVDLGHVGDVLL